ncbi:MAG: hypothetical protein RL113_168 [Pseudomonadota bacterium]
MKRWMISVGLIMLFVDGCSQRSSRAEYYKSNYQRDYKQILYAENHASVAGKKVLKTGRAMMLEDVRVHGGCWDYLNATYRKAGFPLSSLKKVFTGSMKGSFVHQDILKPGDWIYYINHSYHDIQHSGMFVGWADRSRNIGITLSYSGNNRCETLKYDRYDLSHVYSVMRPE